MSKIAILVEFDVIPEHRNAFESLIRGNARHTLTTEPGCLQFDVVTTQDDPTRLFLVEVYRDREAQEYHSGLPRLAEIREKYKNMIRSRRVTIGTIA
jgi:autoinducer 2-degrading protein